MSTSTARRHAIAPNPGTRGAGRSRFYSTRGFRHRGSTAPSPRRILGRSRNRRQARRQSTYHVDGIERDRALDDLSPGDSILHLAFEDLIAQGGFRLIDLGFGKPSDRHSATNIVEPRATLFLLRGTIANRLARRGHMTFHGAMGRFKQAMGKRRDG